MADLGLVDEALDLARAIRNEGARAFALADLAPRLAAAGRLDEALELARAIEDEGAQDQALADLAPRLAEAGRLDDALKTARAIGRRGGCGGPGAPAGRGRTARRGPRDGPGDRTRDGPGLCPGGLGPWLAALPNARLLRLWEETLGLSATRAQSELLSDLSTLAPVIAALGGPEVLNEACQAIRDVGRWWP